MALGPQVEALYQNQYGYGDTIRTICYPVTGLGAGTGLGATATSGAALTWGVWIDVALPALFTIKSRIVAIQVDTPSIIETYAVQIGLTRSLGVTYANAAAVIAAGAATVLAAARREVRYHIAVALGVYGGLLPITPLTVPAGVGVIARISSVSGADTLNVGVVVETGFK